MPAPTGTLSWIRRTAIAAPSDVAQALYVRYAESMGNAISVRCSRSRRALAAAVSTNRPETPSPRRATAHALRRRSALDGASTAGRITTTSGSTPIKRGQK
jgi:hypothetical protein